jgi:hypothetical protein
MLIPSGRIGGREINKLTVHLLDEEDVEKKRRGEKDKLPESPCFFLVHFPETFCAMCSDQPYVWGTLLHNTFVENVLVFKGKIKVIKIN